MKIYVKSWIIKQLNVKDEEKVTIIKTNPDQLTLTRNLPYKIIAEGTSKLSRFEIHKKIDDKHKEQYSDYYYIYIPKDITITKDPKKIKPEITNETGELYLLI